MCVCVWVVDDDEEDDHEDTAAEVDMDVLLGEMEGRK